MIPQGEVYIIISLTLWSILQNFLEAFSSLSPTENKGLGKYKRSKWNPLVEGLNIL
jgi:hypothetical protein